MHSDYLGCKHSTCHWASFWNWALQLADLGKLRCGAFIREFPWHHPWGRERRRYYRAEDKAFSWTHGELGPSVAPQSYHEFGLEGWAFIPPSWPVIAGWLPQKEAPSWQGNSLQLGPSPRKIKNWGTSSGSPPAASGISPSFLKENLCIMASSIRHSALYWVDTFLTVTIM